MSVTVMSLVFGANIPDLLGETNTPNSTAKFVLLALADHASDDGENAYCGIRRLIQKTGFTSSTVCNALKNLIANNYIRYDGKSRVKTNKYAINLQLLESLRFQPLESHDSSHWNQTVLATRAKPSVNHHLKPSLKHSAKTTRPNDKHFDAILSVCCPDSTLTESYKQANKAWIAKTANNGCREFPADLISKAYGAGGWWYEVRCKNITPKPTPTPESIRKTITLAASYYNAQKQAATKVYDDGSFDS